MAQDKKQTILEIANEIVFTRSEEKERMYGPFEEGMAIVNAIFIELHGRPYRTINNKGEGK